MGQTKLNTDNKLSMSASVRSLFSLPSQQNEAEAKLAPHGLIEIHGVIAFIRATTVGGKIIWGSILVCCTSLAILQSLVITWQLLHDKTATRITVHTDAGGLELPAITICPQSPEHTINFEKFVENELKIGDDYSIPFVASFIQAGLGFQKSPNFTTVSTDQIFDINLKLTTWNKILRNPNQILKILAQNYSVPCEDYFQSCIKSILEFDCCDIFKPQITLRRGMCFSTIKNINQNIEGELGNIKITVKHRDRRGSYNVIDISDHNATIPDFRYFVTTHENLLLKIQQKRFEELYRNDGTCLPEASSQLRYFGEYSRPRCFFDIVLGEVYAKRLNCTIAIAHKYDGLPVCSLQQAALQFRPLRRLFETGDGLPSGDLVLKRCKRPCTRKEFNVQTDHLINFKNTYKVKIYYETLQVETVKEVAIQTMAGYVSQIGGALGLWCGISIITVVQLMVFCFVYISQKILERLRFGGNDIKETSEG